jgi:hypothetical protein
VFFFYFPAYEPRYVDSAHIFVFYYFCYNGDIKNDFFKNVIVSEYILVFVIGALNSLHCGGVYIDVLKAILTTL